MAAQQALLRRKRVRSTGNVSRSMQLRQPLSSRSAQPGEALRTPRLAAHAEVKSPGGFSVSAAKRR
jgi:hypothetical protein